MKLSPQFFRRLDESDDTLFYSQPRITKHVDENASQAITEFLRPILPQNELILDLMSSAYSHFPLTIEPKNVVGLGLNQTELEYNSMLGEFYVQISEVPKKSWILDNRIAKISNFLRIEL